MFISHIRSGDFSEHNSTDCTPHEQYVGNVNGEKHAQADSSAGVDLSRVNSAPLSQSNYKLFSHLFLSILRF